MINNISYKFNYILFTVCVFEKKQFSIYMVNYSTRYTKYKNLSEHRSKAQTFLRYKHFYLLYLQNVFHMTSSPFFLQSLRILLAELSYKR